MVIMENLEEALLTQLRSLGQCSETRLVLRPESSTSEQASRLPDSASPVLAGAVFTEDLGQAGSESHAAPVPARSQQPAMGEGRAVAGTCTLLITVARWC